MREEINQKTYRYYIAEGTKALTNNVAFMAGGGAEITVSLHELEAKIHKMTSNEIDNRSADDIIDHMKARLNALGSGV